MNCDDIFRILDDRDIGRLSPNERSAVQSHLDVCPDCAGDWEAHARLLAVEVPRMPDGLIGRCRVIVESRLPRSEPRRARARPFVVVGLLLAGVAAAAVVRLTATQEPASEVAAGAVTEPARVLATAPPPESGAVALEVDRAASQTAAAPAALEIGATERAAVGSGSAAYTVAVAPLPAGIDDPVVQADAEAIHAAVIDALGRVPNLELVLLEADEVNVSLSTGRDAGGPFATIAVADAPQTIALRAEKIFIESDPQAVAFTAVGGAAPTDSPVVFGPGPQSQPHGQPQSQSQNGPQNRSENQPGNRFEMPFENAPETTNFVLNRYTLPVNAAVDFGGSGGKPLAPLEHDFRLTFVIAGRRGAVSNPGDAWSLMVSGISRYGQVATIGSVTAPGQRVDPRAAAAEIVENLRRTLFPPDDLLSNQTRARVVDSALPGSERLSALRDFRMFESRPGFGGADGAGADEAIAAAAVEIASIVAGETRAEVWRLVRGMSDPRLIQPLVDSLLYDTNASVRLEATRTLADFATDPVARAALEYASLADASPMLKMHARWALLDDAGRRDYLVANLLDDTLTDAERLAPILSVGTTGPLEGIERIDLGALVDTDVARVLAELLETSENPETKAMLAARLGGVTSPVLTKLFLRMLSATDEADRFAAAVSLGLRLDEPGVRVALESARDADASGRVRKAAADALENGTPAMFSVKIGQ